MDKIIEFKNIIIGGGITGAGVFRDLSLHGEKTLLIEKSSFMSQTSAASSKMLHGGIRYLEKLEFSLVAEALKEKNLWKNNSHHLVTEKEFFIPIYKSSPHSIYKLWAGVKLYDALSRFQNSPSGKLTKDEILKKIPQLNSENLIGAISYYDTILDDKKFGLEIIDDSLNEYAKAIDNAEINSLEKIDDYYILETNKGKFKSQNIIFATGPFTDQVMRKLGINWIPKILPSKGSHLKLKVSDVPISNPLVIQESSRIIFVIPHGNFILLGTTEKKLQKGSDFFDMKISTEEEEYLIHHFNRYFPKIKIENSIIESTAGVRPLVIPEGISENVKPGAVSRQHQIFMPQKNMYVLIGGKYTTFRKMASDLVSQMFRKSQKVYNPNLSLEPIRKSK